jgi:hypothetical protein
MAQMFMEHQNSKIIFKSGCDAVVFALKSRRAAMLGYFFDLHASHQTAGFDQRLCAQTVIRRI